MDYLELLYRLHTALRPAVYLEIGVEFGNSLRLSRSRSVAIDPMPQLRPEALASKPWVKLYQQPSDDFFRTHTAASTLEGHSLDLAFIDGLHEFAQVVRDLEHIEQWSHPGTVVVIHDVLPRGRFEAGRVRQGIDWTGDVWRIVPFLLEHRPDLSCSLVSAEPTGVLVVTRFNPDHRGMSELAATQDAHYPRDGEAYEQLVEKYLEWAQPKSGDEFLRELHGAERPVGYRLETDGWMLQSGTSIYQPMPDHSNRSLRIVLDEPVRGAFRIRLCVSARGVELIRLDVISREGEHIRQRHVFLDVERPGALHHELERVGLYHDPERDTFALELEGTLFPDEELRAVTLEPTDASLAVATVAEDMTIGLQGIEMSQVPAVSRTVPVVADWPGDRLRPPSRKNGGRDAVVFAWFVPEHMPELGQYYMNLLRYYHFDSKIFIGMNNRSDPLWENRVRECGLDVDIRWARPEMEDYWDATGFLAALEAYSASTEPFELIWFGHTKGGSQSDFGDYSQTRFALVRNFWARRGRIEQTFCDSKIGIFAPRFSPLPTGHFGDELPALLRIYRGEHAPIGLHAKETFYVMRDEIVRAFCQEVDADFFRTPLGSYGAGRFFFEIGFPNIASIQGFEPFIDPDVVGENHPRDDVWLSYDPKQNHRLANAELERWRLDSMRFEPRAIRELWDPARP